MSVTAPELPQAAEQIGRVVILENPACTGAQSVARERIEELEASRYAGNILRLTTHVEGERTVDLLRSNLEEGDALCIAGGDGTVRQGLTAVMTPELVPLQVPLVPMWCGNGNDLAHMLNGRPKPLSGVLEQGKIAPVRSIRALIQDERGTREELASIYSEVGAGAIGAERLNDKNHRARRLYKYALGRIAYEVPTLLGSFAEAQLFDIEEDGQLRQIYDIAVANGSRMAKFARLPVNLFDEKLFAFRATERQVWPIARRMAALGMGIPRGEYIAEEPLTFTVKDRVMMHFDAETQVLEPDTVVSIGQHKMPYYTVTTKYAVEP
ncbi:MAG TPA: diacylglycerol kinase family protein [Candidatus Saccharimonadales bacterium]|nr:diacylglycerol kinase family protein [Candidatus Saccharimonadales bacterium]